MAMTVLQAIVAAMAFMFASTNLVIELGMVRLTVIRYAARCEARLASRLAARFQRCSMRAKRHTASAITQVAANSPTMMNPAWLMSKCETYDQKPPVRLSCVASSPKSSIDPTMSATATDSPVIVML